ncbi:glycosyl transferase, group 1 [Trichodesmium erythraeum IMS101]|uniref:Glycosyl transferase, group 1 n=1 Tax=Trichodesmium erythraeum (strain IMS101) TaxID=203124 RepID=Q115L8_TRIEI|nr:glycosyltransferase family 4 protein [Trichodesmium erythraeum GBRTRLIN201]MCH2047570.1 glycosyltransferase family 4 protein [Trichodesmium sp. ALOHA_ZT_67]MDE5094579.1 glycosyltransferase family 4 protein [Trichodesmium sp. St11_bin5]MDT9342481.1 glycosyltransferase family 4 protein [Trichodesmium erythraeum 21-75]
MRILIYSYNYNPELIGIAPLMTELAEGFAKRGHQVRVVTGMPNYPERKVYDGYKGKFFLTEYKNGVTVQRSYIHVRGSKPGVLARLLLDGSFIVSSLWQAFNGWKPEIIFATTPPILISLPVSFYGLFSKSSVVLNIQDIVSEAAVRVGLVNKNSWIVSLAQAVEKLAYFKADKISVITEDFVTKLVEQGVSKDRIVCISNWVDINFIRPLNKNNYFRAEHNLQDKFVVIYSGNIALTQGLETVVKAAASLKEKSEISFVILGEETARQQLQECCNNYQADNILLLPLVPREKLPEMLSAADVGLVIQKKTVTAFNLPSKIPVILASGRPIIASVPDTGTAMRVVKESGGGIVVTPEDFSALAQAILELYENPKKLEELGQQGRKYAEENFGSKNALNSYEALFAEILSCQERGEKKKGKG